MGQTVMPALRAAQDLAPLGIDAAVVNARFVKPLDRVLFRDLLLRVPRLITVEDHTVVGGFGSAMLEFMAEEGITGVEVRRWVCPIALLRTGLKTNLENYAGLTRTHRSIGVTNRSAGKKEKQGGMGKRERLDLILIQRELVTSREEGRRRILAAEVLVNEQPLTKAGALVDRTAEIRLKTVSPYVSRGGLKLEKALRHFSLT